MSIIFNFKYKVSVLCAFSVRGMIGPYLFEDDEEWWWQSLVTIQCYGYGSFHSCNWKMSIWTISTYYTARETMVLREKFDHRIISHVMQKLTDHQDSEIWLTYIMFLAGLCRVYATNPQTFYSYTRTLKGPSMPLSCKCVKM